MSDWREHHAEAATEALKHPTVARAIENYCENMGFAPGKFPQGVMLQKVVDAAVQVARAQALGFDPELLRDGSDVAAIVEAAARSGRPVWVIANYPAPPDRV